MNLQKQSHQLDDSTRIYINTLQTTNTANSGVFSSNISYVVMGNDNGVMCSSTSSLAEMPSGCGLFSRIEREWKVTKTNFGQLFNVDL